MATTRAYPLDAPCMDCGARPTRWIRFWVNGMKYRTCKEHTAEYRGRCSTGINPRTGEPTRNTHVFVEYGRNSERLEVK